MSELPKGWVVTKIGDILQPQSDGKLIHQGWSPQCHAFPAGMNEWGVLKTTAIQDGSFLDIHNKKLPDDKEPKSRIEVRNGDLLMTNAGPRIRCGVTTLVKKTRNKLMLSGKMYRMRFDETCIDPSYIEACFRSEAVIKEIDSRKTGMSESGLNLTQERFLTVPIILCPYKEQVRIANKLDSMLAKVDAAQTRLDKIPNILKRFRQSVLAAAISGELTKEWREAKEANIDKWEVLRLEDVCNSVTDGDHQAPPKAETGVPFLVISNVNKGVVDLDKASRWVPQSYFDSLKDIRKPLKGDILYTVTGSYGIPVKVLDDSEFCFQRHIAILKPNHSLVDKDYLFQFLSSSNAFEQAAKHATGTAQKTLPLKGLRGFEVTMPPMDEQKEIVRRVETVFTMADTVEKQYKDAKARTNRLTQSILAKAFRGELVPQDENDEPASELLKRITEAQMNLKKVTVKNTKAKKVANV